MMPPSTAPIKLVAFWKAFSTRWNPILVIIVAWALLTIPLVFFRGFNSDEGLAVTIAQSALKDGNWLTPHLFNLRFVERPTLLSWIIAAFSLPFGNVSQITARLPVALFLLAGCLLIFHVLRRVGATTPAAMLGVALFLACPLVVRSYVMVTADMPLAVLLFLAFVWWWDGNSAGSVGLGRWTAIGGALALSALMKGPQPTAYFAIGISVFILITRGWWQIPGLVLAGIICLVPLVGWYACVYAPGDEAQWASFMRLTPAVTLSGPIQGTWDLVIETLPATLLGGAFLLSGAIQSTQRIAPDFVKALACYAFITALIVLFWPAGSAVRYFFPMVLPLCVLGGLAYDSMCERSSHVIAPMLVVTMGILAYALMYSVIASPVLPARFRSTKLDAARIAKLIRASPAPIFRTPVVGLNIFPYVPARIATAPLKTLESMTGPAWIAVPADVANDLHEKRPRILHTVLSFGSSNEWQLLRLEKSPEQ